MAFSELDSSIRLCSPPRNCLQAWTRILRIKILATTQTQSHRASQLTTLIIHLRPMETKRQYRITIMDPGELDVATLRRPIHGNPFHNDSTLNNVKLDKDKLTGLQRITKTFESVRSDIATVWNKAMVWIDDEVVFLRLNTLLTVAKEGTDRVIETVVRAETNATNTLRGVHAEQANLHAESVKRSNMHRTYQNRPKPLPTGNGGLIPKQRVHVRGENPQPRMSSYDERHRNRKTGAIAQNATPGRCRNKIRIPQNRCHGDIAPHRNKGKANSNFPTSGPKHHSVTTRGRTGSK